MSNKNILYYIAFCGCVAFAILSKCQSSLNDSNTMELMDTINLRDSLGFKQGLWIDTTKFQSVIHANYVNDTLNGVFKSYYLKNNILLSEGTYQMGERVGTWYWYNRQNGYLLFEESEMGVNSDITVPNNGNPYVPPKISYVKIYEPRKGYLAKEGYILFADSFDEDTHVKYGKWIYYNEKGEITKTEKY